MRAELFDFVTVVYIIQNTGLRSSIKSGASHLHLTLQKNVKKKHREEGVLEAGKQGSAERVLTCPPPLIMCSSHSTVLMCKVDKSFINALCVHQQASSSNESEPYGPSVQAAAALHLFHRFPPGSNYGYGVREKSIIHKNTLSVTLRLRRFCLVL